MAKPVRTSESRNLSQAGPGEPVLIDGKEFDDFNEGQLTRLEWRRLTEGAWPDGKELTDLELWERYRGQKDKDKTHPPWPRPSINDPEVKESGDHLRLKEYDKKVYLEEAAPFGKEAFERAAEILKEFGETHRHKALQGKSNARLYELGRIHANVLVIMAKNHPTPMTELYFQGFDDKIAEILASNKQEALPADEENKKEFSQERLDEIQKEIESPIDRTIRLTPNQGE